MENNVVETNKKKNLVIAVMACVIVFLIVLLVYFIFIKKDQSGESNKPKDDVSIQGKESKELYHIVDGEEYIIYSDASETNEKVSFDYPQFDIESDDLSRINNEIKELYDKNYNDLFKNSINPGEGDYYVNKDNKKYGSEEIYIPKYNISETDKYLSILILDVRYCNCSGQTAGYGYVYDKATKKLLSNEEILKLFNVTPQEFIQYYNQHGGCQANNDSIDSLDNQKIFIKDKELYFENPTCCCQEISKYGEEN